MIQILQQSHRDFKITMIQMFKKMEKNGEFQQRPVICKKIVNGNTRTKTSITEIHNSIHSFKKRLHIAKEV